MRVRVLRTRSCKSPSAGFAQVPSMAATRNSSAPDYYHDSIKLVPHPRACGDGSVSGCASYPGVGALADAVKAAGGGPAKPYEPPRTNRLVHPDRTIRCALADGSG